MTTRVQQMRVLDDQILARIVFRISDPAAGQKLFEEADLTVDKAIKMVEIQESVTNTDQSLGISPTTTTTPPHHVDSTSQNKRRNNASIVGAQTLVIHQTIAQRSDIL